MRGVPTACFVRVEAGRLTAHGTQLGADPYRLDYRLRTGPDFVTESVELSLLAGRRADAACCSRASPDGSWTADDRPLPELDGALDCDVLAYARSSTRCRCCAHAMLAGGAAARPRDGVGDGAGPGRDALRAAL